jgi:hypothetical protein
MNMYPRHPSGKCEATSHLHAAGRAATVTREVPLAGSPHSAKARRTSLWRRSAQRPVVGESQRTCCANKGCQVGRRITDFAQPGIIMHLGLGHAVPIRIRVNSWCALWRVKMPAQRRHAVPRRGEGVVASSQLTRPEVQARQSALHCGLIGLRAAPVGGQLSFFVPCPFALTVVHAALILHRCVPTHGNVPTTDRRCLYAAAFGGVHGVSVVIYMGSNSTLETRSGRKLTTVTRTADRHE